MTLSEPRVRPWSKQEYRKLVELGWFEGQHVQLINGQIMQLPAQSQAHAKAVSHIADILRNEVGGKHWVRVRSPLNLHAGSEPEPDLALTDRGLGQSADHPSMAMLVVEVSDNTLSLDRRKTGLYASAGIGDYWILNLPEQQLEVYREPMGDATNEFGVCYGHVQRLSLSDTIIPLALPQTRIRVADLLPS